MKRKREPNRYFALRSGYILRKVYGHPWYELVATKKFGRLKTKTQHKRTRCLSPGGWKGYR